MQKRKDQGAGKLGGEGRQRDLELASVGSLKERLLWGHLWLCRSVGICVGLCLWACV